MQKYIALFNQVESFSDFRRTNNVIGLVANPFVHITLRFHLFHRLNRTRPHEPILIELGVNVQFPIKHLHQPVNVLEAILRGVFPEQFPNTIIQIRGDRLLLLIFKKTSERRLIRPDARRVRLNANNGTAQCDGCGQPNSKLPAARNDHGCFSRWLATDLSAKHHAKADGVAPACRDEAQNLLFQFHFVSVL